MVNTVSVLHVIDDEKFIIYSEQTFNLNFILNTYCNSDEFRNILMEKEFDVVILHYLNYRKAKVINNIKIKPPIIWFFWGNDGFRLGKFHNKFLLPKTKKLRLQLELNKSFKHKIKNLVKYFFPYIIDIGAYNAEIIKSFKKLDLIVPVVPEDYFLLKEKYFIKAPMFHLNYVNPIFENSEVVPIIENNILLGNSASFTNNHVEAINLLSEINLGKRKVIIPLSYGNKLYGDYISRYSKKKLGDNAICLIDFLSFDKYQEIIRTCSIVIMNHLRQQALGNIAQSFMNGAHIYLNKSSVLFEYLNKNNFIIEDINNLNSLRELNSDERMYNRKKCIEVFNKDLQQEKVKELFKYAQNLKKEPTSFPLN